MNLLFIGLIVLFTSHKQCNRCWTLKKKQKQKKKKTTLNTDTNAHYSNKALDLQIYQAALSPSALKLTRFRHAIRIKQPSVSALEVIGPRK